MATPLILLDGIYFKREDLNLTGSVKDRSIPIQLQNVLHHHHQKAAVISSTGNAAISASHFAKEYGIKLTIFVSPKINPHKLSFLSRENVITSPTPVSDAYRFAKQNHIHYLRQSTDPVALSGYADLGNEIMTQLPLVSDIFLPVGSGSTLVGIASVISPNTRMFSVQPASHAPISSKFDPNFIPEPTTPTDALGTKLLPLKTRVITSLHHSHGGGFVITTREVEEAQDWLQQHQITTSPEGALALAGYFKAKSLKLPQTGQYPLILLTGCQR